MKIEKLLDKVDLSNAVKAECCCHDSVISFNEKEAEAVTFKSSIRAITNKEMIPFAIDPFGNYFCYSLKTKKISFYNHEKNSIEETIYSFTEFLNSLH